MACYRSSGTSANKFIKVYTVSYACNYFNRADKRLMVKMPGNDTCTVFTFNKHSTKQFTENAGFFAVCVKNKKNLVDRDFNQVTFKGYHDIGFCADPAFLLVQVNENNTLLTGVINFKEEQVVPFQYSDIKFNTQDSLVVACSAGIRATTEDDIYNYEGKKVASYHKHVDMVTKNFVIYKLYEPKEYYIINNIATKEEKPLYADEVQLLGSDEILIRIKNDWFIYDMITNQKKPKQS